MKTVCDKVEVSESVYVTCEALACSQLPLSSHHVNFPAPFHLSHSRITPQGPPLHEVPIHIGCEMEGPLVDAPHP